MNHTAIAKRWLASILESGINGVTFEQCDHLIKENDKATFIFTHAVTGAQNMLAIKGDGLKSAPVELWNGKVNTTPTLADFLPKGWCVEFRPLKPSEIITDLVLSSDFSVSMIDCEGKDYTFSHRENELEVYLSKTGLSVLKVPVFPSISQQERKGFIAAIQKEEGTHVLPISLKRNLMTYLTYTQAPQEVKKFFPNTRLLDNGWLLQEHTEKMTIGRYWDIGKCQDGRYVLLDGQASHVPYSINGGSAEKFDYSWIENYLKQFSDEQKT